MVECQDGNKTPITAPKFLVRCFKRVSPDTKPAKDCSHVDGGQLATTVILRFWGRVPVDTRGDSSHVVNGGEGAARVVVGFWGRCVT